jgi:broad specificity phosphatase PhoE
MLWPQVVAQHAEGISARELIFSSPGGETYDQVMGRLDSFLEELPAEPERRVVVVSHGGSGRLLRGAYAGLRKAEILTLDVPHAAVWRLANGQIDRFDCEPVD